VVETAIGRFDRFLWRDKRMKSIWSIADSKEENRSFRADDDQIIAQQRRQEHSGTDNRHRVICPPRWA
jgi:hypothetical protein